MFASAAGGFVAGGIAGYYINDVLGESIHSENVSFLFALFTIVHSRQKKEEETPWTDASRLQRFLILPDNGASIRMQYLQPHHQWAIRSLFQV
jgi:hypothetical protein